MHEVPSYTELKKEIFVLEKVWVNCKKFIQSFKISIEKLMNILIVFYSEMQYLCMNNIHLLKRKENVNKNKIKEISIQYLKIELICCNDTI